MYDDMNNNGSYSGNGYDNGGYGNGYNSGSYGNGGYSNGSYGNGQPAYDRPLTRKARRAMKKVQKLDRKKASGNSRRDGKKVFAGEASGPGIAEELPDAWTGRRKVMPEGRLPRA